MELKGILSEILNKHFDDIKTILINSKLFDKIKLEEDESFEFYLTNKEKGITLLFSRDHILEYIYLYSDGYEGSKGYSALPLELDFSMNPDGVSKMFQGILKKEGGNRQTPIVGWMNLWENYTIDNTNIKVHYNKGADKIEYITISKLK